MHHLLLLIALIFSSTAYSTEQITVTVNEKSAWARTTPPGTTTTAIYLTLSNHGKTDLHLTNASANISDRIELHTHTNHDGMMKMQQIDSIKIPAGEDAELKPHGKHIMVFNLSKPLKDGDTVELNLDFDNQHKLTISLPALKNPPMPAVHQDKSKKAVKHDEHNSH